MIKLKLSRINLLFLALATLTFYSALSSGMRIATSQMIAFPLLAIVVLGLLKDIHRGVVLMVGAALVCGFAWHWQSKQMLSSNSVYVTQLDKEEFDLRGHGLTRYLKLFKKNRTNIRFERANIFLKDLKQAQSLVAENSLRGLVWGNVGWLRVSLPSEEPVALPEFLGLQIAKSVPLFSLSYYPANATAYFIMLIFESLHATDRGMAELALKEAGGFRSFWKTTQHRAFPLFRLGNMALEDAIRDGRYEAGSLHCAAVSLYKALKYMGPKDNPQLTAAIYNNLGVVSFVKGVQEGNHNDVKLARTYFKRAVEIVSRRNSELIDTSSGQIALANLNRIR